VSTKSVDNPRFARMYVKAAARAERRGADEHRTRLLAGLQGDVLELGAGHGLNFAHYPKAVERVIALEPNSALREQAEAAAAKAPIDIEVATAWRTPFRSTTRAWTLS
jgi:hypothetical protein